METGFVGETGHEVVDLEDDMTEEERNDVFWEMAVNWAESYGRYLDEEDEDGEVYASDQVEGYGEPYNEEKHGGSW